MMQVFYHDGTTLLCLHSQDTLQQHLVNFIELLCVCSAHVELGKGHITHKRGEIIVSL